MWLGQMSYAQSRIEGRVLDGDSNTIMSNVEVKLIAPNYERVTRTDADGHFSFENINTGSYTLVVAESGYFESSMDVDYISGEASTIPDIMVERNTARLSNVADLPTIDQGDDESSNSSSNGVASLLNSSRDIFAFNAFMAWSQGGFRSRGFNGQEQTLFINGIPMDNILRGNQLNFQDYVGLNDVLRSRNNYYGIKAIPFTFGELTNNTDVDAEAINQRKGLRVSQLLSNRNFTSRTAITYSTGLLKNNFAFSGSVAFRGAKEGYILGTGMQQLSGYLSISKKFSQKLISSLSMMYVDNLRSTSTAATKEFYQLAGTNYYNPNWGMYNGEKRSASIRRDNAPMITLSNEFKPSDNTTIFVSGAYQFGKRYSERLDWYNSLNPSPTYYRNQPSYYLDDPIVYEQMTQNIVNHPEVLQIDWQRLYDANASNWDSVPTKNISGKRASYWMNRETQKVSSMTLNTIVNHQLNNIVALNGGILLQRNQTQNYREVSDLMGADFIVNVNQFAQRANPTDPDAIQNDMNNPYEVVREGGTYGYNYHAKAMNIAAWAQSVMTWKSVDAFVALRVENTSYSREGLYRNGAYKNNSYGASPSKSFTNFSFKGGLTYKINGKNYLSLNAMRISQAPQFEQVFVLPRTTNIISDNTGSMTVNSGEITYNHRGATNKFYIAACYSLSQNETEVRNFYTELANSFGTMVTRGVDKKYIGLELAAESKIASTGLTAIGIANIGDYVYANRPTYNFYYDNSEQVSPYETVYFQNLHLATGPQIAGTLKLQYNSKQFWTASLALNYFDKIYVEPSPQRRTTEAIDNVDPTSSLYSKILTQERLPSQMTVDAFFRKSFMLNKYIKTLKKRMYLDINIQASNILDNKNFAYSGREQLRFDFRDNNPDKYPNRYYYMMGRTYSINLIFRM